MFLTHFKLTSPTFARTDRRPSPSGRTTACDKAWPGSAIGRAGQRSASPDGPSGVGKSAGAQAIRQLIAAASISPSTSPDSPPSAALLTLVVDAAGEVPARKEALIRGRLEKARNWKVRWLLILDEATCWTAMPTDIRLLSVPAWTTRPPLKIVLAGQGAACGHLASSRSTPLLQSDRVPASLGAPGQGRERRPHRLPDQAGGVRRSLRRNCQTLIHDFSGGVLAKSTPGHGLLGAAMADNAKPGKTKTSVRQTLNEFTTTRNSALSKEPPMTK